MFSCTLFISINESFKEKETHSSRWIDLDDFFFDFSNIGSILISKWISNVWFNTFIWIWLVNDYGPHSLVIPSRSLKWYLIRCSSNHSLPEWHWAFIRKRIYDRLMGTRRNVYFLFNNKLWHILVCKISFKRNWGTFWSSEKIIISKEKKKSGFAKHKSRWKIKKKKQTSLKTKFLDKFCEVWW